MKINLFYFLYIVYLAPLTETENFANQIAFLHNVISKMETKYTSEVFVIHPFFEETQKF